MRNTLYYLLFCFLTISAIICDENEKDVREWVKLLGDSDFAKREKATRELMKVSFKYSKLLKEELDKTDDLEIQERIKILLDQSEEKLLETFSENLSKSQTYIEEKKYNEALKIVNEILEIKPDFKRAIDIKIQILEATNDYNSCIQIRKKQLEGIDKVSDDADQINFSLSRYYMIVGNYSECTNLLEGMKTTSRLMDEVDKKLAAAYEYNNQINKAEEILKKLHKEEPNDFYNGNNLAWFYIRTGNISKAKELLKVNTKSEYGFEITSVLNCIFTEQTQIGAEELKKSTESFINNIKNNKNLSIDDIPPMQTIYFCYQYYFEKTNNLPININFKEIYQSVNDDDKKIWPMPLLGLYGGVLTPEKMLEQVPIPSKIETKMNLCEAYFYLGLLKLTEKNTKEARKYFQLSKDQKIYDYVETTGSEYFLITTK